MECPDFASQIGEVLDINFFELKYLKLFVKEIYVFREAYKTFPNKETFQTILETKLKENSEDLALKQANDFFKRIGQSEKSINEEYVKRNSIEFCKKQKLKEALIKSVDLLKTSSFDEIKDLINKAILLGSNNDQGYDYIDNFEKRYAPNCRNAIPTGWDVLDSYIQGGLGEGELGVFTRRNRFRKKSDPLLYCRSCS